MNNIINVALIKDYIKNNNLTQAEFCKLCRISAGTLKKIFNGGINFDLRAILKISRVLNVNMCELFKT